MIDTTEESTVTELRTDITAALRKAGRKINSTELYELLGTDEPRPKVMSEIMALKKTGEVVSFPGDSPRKTLYAIGSGSAPHPRPPSPRARGFADKTDKKPAKPPKRKPKADPAPAASCNVADFLPAMTADKRLVIVGGTEPLMFSIEQTQNIADLIFENFEANA